MQHQRQGHGQLGRDGGHRPLEVQALGVDIERAQGARDQVPQIRRVPPFLGQQAVRRGQGHERAFERRTISRTMARYSNTVVKLKQQQLEVPSSFASCAGVTSNPSQKMPLTAPDALVMSGRAAVKMKVRYRVRGGFLLTSLVGDRGLMRLEGASGGVDLVEPLEEALVSNAGKGVPDRPADPVLAPEHPAVHVIDELHDMVGPRMMMMKPGACSNSTSRWPLPGPSPFGRTVRVVSVQVTGTHRRMQPRLRIVDRAIAIGPVDVFALAVARVIGTRAFSCQVAPPPDMTWSICGPMMSQISAQTSRAGVEHQASRNVRSGPIDCR